MTMKQIGISKALLKHKDLSIQKKLIKGHLWKGSPGYASSNRWAKRKTPYIMLVLQVLEFLTKRHTRLGFRCLIDILVQ